MPYPAWRAPKKLARGHSHGAHWIVLSTARLVTLGPTVALVLMGAPGIHGGQVALSAPAGIEAAQHLFYSARFEEAADRAQQLLNDTPEDLAAFELRTSALHFQIRRAMGDRADRKAALAACEVCPRLLEIFLADIQRGKREARMQLTGAPGDEEAMYYLAKINLNYLWLQLSTLGRRTGWDEYWEAKRLLEAVLTKTPMHVRARVARAWMDYIVGTRVPWGTRWVMGGGNKGRGLNAMREATRATGEYYAEVEARFGMWEMLSREGRRQEALTIARELLATFPENRDLARFVEAPLEKRAP